MHSFEETIRAVLNDRGAFQHCRYIDFLFQQCEGEVFARGVSTRYFALAQTVLAQQHGLTGFEYLGHGHNALALKGSGAGVETQAVRFDSEPLVRADSRHLLQATAVFHDEATQLFFEKLLLITGYSNENTYENLGRMMFMLLLLHHEGRFDWRVHSRNMGETADGRMVVHDPGNFNRDLYARMSLERRARNLLADFIDDFLVADRAVQSHVQREWVAFSLMGSRDVAGLTKLAEDKGLHAMRVMAEIESHPGHMYEGRSLVVIGDPHQKIKGDALVDTLGIERQVRGTITKAHPQSRFLSLVLSGT